MAFRLPIAVYLCRISCSTSASVYASRSPAAIKRSEQQVRVRLMQVSSSHLKHRNVGVDAPLSHPASISSSLLDVGGGEGVTDSAPDRFQFGLRITPRLRDPGLAEGARTDSPTVSRFPPGQVLDVLHFLVP